MKKITAALLPVSGVDHQLHGTLVFFASTWPCAMSKKCCLSEASELRMRRIGIVVSR
ncbi:hypothetical protein [Paraburkholderia sp. RL18-085-BIA-A]|uniref:hypothetical protein n=1 Tax=Paraburkholderia sp. RL18-085-BIA-A TaxID=3031633 RepID=UPI0038BB3DF6